MHSSLQELEGEIAWLRAECEHLVRALDTLADHSRYPGYLTEEQHDEISSVNRNYSRSTKENLERAGDDLQNWRWQLEQVLQHRGRLRF